MLFEALDLLYNDYKLDFNTEEPSGKLLTEEYNLFVVETVLVAMYLFDEFVDYEICSENSCLSQLQREKENESAVEFLDRCITMIENEYGLSFDHNMHLENFENKLNLGLEKFDKKDITYIVEQAHCSEIFAAIYLINNKYDMVDAIMKIPL